MIEMLKRHEIQVRHRRRQHALSRRQRAPSAASSDDLHHEQIPEAWGRELHDVDLAQAIIDRVLSAAVCCGSTAPRSAPCTSTLTRR
jgi:hypothetical protein